MRSLFRNIEINQGIDFFSKRKLVTYLILVVVMVFHFFIGIKKTGTKLLRKLIKMQKIF